MQTTRRTMMELAVRAAALPGGAEFMAAWLQAQEHSHTTSSSAPPQPPYLVNRKPAFFSPEDFAALEAFTEILIPSDGTPGAKEAHCAQYIDFLMTASDGMAVQKQWRDSLAAIKKAGFHAADAQGKERLIAAMAKPEVERGTTHPAYSAYLLIKQQNAFAYYTARAGMIENLDYKGNSYNLTFPACTHPEHRRL